MKQLLILTGTRPEIIKMAPVHQELSTLPGLNVAWCHSGQHDIIAAQMFDFFGITPDIVLTRPAGNELADLLAGLVQGCNAVMGEQDWDMVLVHGDTSTTLAGALAAFYRHVPVGHVEAGLRSGQLEEPFPEESNRKLVASLATRHYAPTPRALANLRTEHVATHDILLTGNTVVDAQQLLARHYGIRRAPARFPRLLVTAHRRENWPYLTNICEALLALCRHYPALEAVFPLHPNPLVRQIVHPLLDHEPRICLTAPLDYVALQQELAQATLVLTDSGGIQEEAAGFRVPCLVLRDTTERPEAIEAGMADLVGIDPARILAAARVWIEGERRIDPGTANPFGDGHAARRIRQDVADFLDLPGKAP
ncbi:MAG: UDP-N-acetylglucosamine 2-epimerase (non-hydrolyzing) [Laribacter sp.]|nr:UDP-N-acetylglucosamine 2-epimerase (non-hydrolyzing) [Laribacter sp.]MBP9528054.1 UDP-N-acetylglucosamine 2-epimerase (non-hydrolyzing) [Laribacter sp.]MBP9608753.1 UDP-N-acetylglucosamine 2-epimerase (non-hydrolyzing) [Laribacter sp.]